MEGQNDMQKDPYSVLDVAHDATDVEIKVAFRRLAHKHHPDKGGLVSRYREVDEAYRTLMDPVARKRYDLWNGVQTHTVETQVRTPFYSPFSFSQGKTKSFWGIPVDQQGVWVNSPDLKDLYEFLKKHGII